MFFPFVLLVVSVFYKSCYPERQIEGLKFPDDLQTLCPYTSFCNLNASKPLPKSERKIPCCRSCSCDPDCGLTRTCCHDDLDEHKLVDTLQMICKPLNTKKLHDRTDDYYYIIDKCPNQQDTCEEFNESMYGSFSPVFSHQTGMIYYNSVCAECHNQTDTSRFIPTIACHSLNFYGLSTVFDAINGLDEECYYNFVIPREIDISHQKCYPRIIRSCLVKDDVDLVHKCSSFNATFLSKWVKTYQNIYCYQCNIKDLTLPESFLESFSLCKKPEEGRLFGGSVLTILLNKNTIDLYERSITKHMANEDTICFSDSTTVTKKCRPKLCPEGHFRVEGRCQLLGETWYLQLVSVWINLTFTDTSDNLTIHDLQHVPEKELLSLNRDILSRPALEDWYIKLFYGLKDDGTSVQFLLANLFLRDQVLKTAKVLQDVEDSVKGFWKLDVDGKTFKLRAAFNKYVDYFSNNGTSSRTAYSPASALGRDDINTVYFWTGHIFENVYEVEGVSISKMFYCNQVTLEVYEFIHSDVERARVYIKHSKKHLGNGEFIVKHGIFNEGIRICVHDLVENDAKRTAFNPLEFLLVQYILKFIL